LFALGFVARPAAFAALSGYLNSGITVGTGCGCGRLENTGKMAAGETKPARLKPIARESGRPGRPRSPQGAVVIR